MNKIHTSRLKKRDLSTWPWHKQVGFCENGIRYHPASCWYPHMLSQHEMGMLSQHGMRAKLQLFFPPFSFFLISPSGSGWKPSQEIHRQQQQPAPQPSPSSFVYTCGTSPKGPPFPPKNMMRPCICRVMKTHFTWWWCVLNGTSF